MPCPVECPVMGGSLSQVCPVQAAEGEMSETTESREYVESGICSTPECVDLLFCARTCLRILEGESVGQRDGVVSAVGGAEQQFRGLRVSGQSVESFADEVEPPERPQIGVVLGLVRVTIEPPLTAMESTIL